MVVVALVTGLAHGSSLEFFEVEITLILFMTLRSTCAALDALARGSTTRRLQSRFVIIRDANGDDWPAIYPIFRAIVDAGATYAYPENLASDDARRLWMEPAPGHCVVALDADTILGSAKMGPNRPARGAHVATASFMVDPGQQGRGVGLALGTYALDWARASGYRSMQFNAVVETNVGAVRLRQRLGFEILTTVPEAFDQRDVGLVGLHVMHRSL
jgi:L-amino acid N-acyltransferase YncA